MGNGQPFMYDAVALQDHSSLPYKPFDPKPYSRAAEQTQPLRERRGNGPLVSFNVHPE